MQFIDLKTQYAEIKENVLARMNEVLDSGQYIFGPVVEECEQKLAELVGAKHCLSMGSGTDALIAALLAIDIKPGDEVIVPAFSFYATAEMVSLLGAIPVFVDVNPKTFNIDCELIEKYINNKTKAIIPVSLYGQAADFDKINAVASNYKLPVIEDGAQSYGAKYKDRFSCNLSDIACTSFYPAKPLGCYGEGGACFTNNDELAERMKIARNHGQTGGYHHTHLGFNGRLDALQCAVIIEKLKIFPGEVEKRQSVAKLYNELLSDRIITPYVEEHNISSWAQYTIQVENREEIRAKLSEQNIPTAVHYPKPMHMQPYYQDLGFKKGIAPISETICDKVLSLPMHPYLSQNDVEKISTELLKLV